MKNNGIKDSLKLDPLHLKEIEKLRNNMPLGWNKKNIALFQDDKTFNQTQHMFEKINIYLIVDNTKFNIMEEIIVILLEQLKIILA